MVEMEMKIVELKLWNASMLCWNPDASYIVWSL
jgi:hypothetical protein